MARCLVLPNRKVNSYFQNFKPYSMKKLVLIIAAVFFGTAMTKAETLEDKVAITNYRYGNNFIFVERGVTFSVYPDGEFDFYIDNQVNVGVGARVGNVGITFNSGYNYNPFVQYDDYGAVIQVENVPIFYDYYGRVSQIGGVDVWYRNGRLRRLGGLNVYWNGGVFSHYTGFINVYNRGYVYRPFHRWFARPGIGFCNVWRTPYRRFYSPVRYTYYRPYRYNHRRAYAKIGRDYRYNRTPRRANIYRNDRRVAVRNNNGRRNTDFARNSRNVTRRGEVSRSNRNTIARSGRSDRSVADRGTVARSNRNGVRSSANRTTPHRNSTVGRSVVRKGNDGVKRSNRGSSVTQRSVTRTPRGTTVTKREVTQTPRKRTVTKKSTTYRKPQSKSRSVVSNRSAGKRTQGVQKRSAPQRKTVSRSSSSRRSASATSRTVRSSRRK